MRVLQSNRIANGGGSDERGGGGGPGKGPATGDQGYCAPNSTPGQVLNSFCWQMSKCNLIFIN